VTLFDIIAVPASGRDDAGPAVFVRPNGSGVDRSPGVEDEHHYRGAQRAATLEGPQFFCFWLCGKFLCPKTDKATNRRGR